MLGTTRRGQWHARMRTHATYGRALSKECVCTFICAYARTYKRVHTPPRRYATHRCARAHGHAQVWFVFPHFVDNGSEMSKRYQIHSDTEAKSYLQHAVPLSVAIRAVCNCVGIGRCWDLGTSRLLALLSRHSSREAWCRYLISVMINNML